ncbi:hypothetical protein [Actinoallomurus sp. NPDC052274]|uniref:hypothetical protein n=1 Tax=Actinoallomurus sp. NPDC052274 TaxID=3155420 RepID=UPI003423415E
MRAHRRGISVLLGTCLVAAAGWAAPPAGAARTGPRAAAQRILIDAASGGHTFDGIGALSAARRRVASSVLVLVLVRTSARIVSQQMSRSEAVSVRVLRIRARPVSRSKGFRKPRTTIP